MRTICSASIPSRKGALRTAPKISVASGGGDWAAPALPLNGTSSARKQTNSAVRATSAPVLDVRIKESLYRRKDVRFHCRRRQPVFCAGIGHELKLDAASLQLRHESGRIHKQHVVIGHSMSQK